MGRPSAAQSFIETALMTLILNNNQNKYWVGQKLPLGFSQHLLEKPRTNFLANPIINTAADSI